MSVRWFKVKGDDWQVVYDASLKEKTLKLSEAGNCPHGGDVQDNCHWYTITDKQSFAAMIEALRSSATTVAIVAATGNWATSSTPSGEKYEDKPNQKIDVVLPARRR